MATKKERWTVKILNRSLRVSDCCDSSGTESDEDIEQQQQQPQPGGGTSARTGDLQEEGIRTFTCSLDPPDALTRMRPPISTKIACLLVC
jgi:hypothetical protein